MAITWPLKNNFIDGDVLSAANMNNIGDTVNVFNPTSATNGQVLTANGSGSASFQNPSAAYTLLASGNLNGTLGVDISSISASYETLELYFINAVTPGNSANLLVNTQTTGYCQMTTRSGSTTVVTGTGNAQVQALETVGATINYHLVFPQYAQSKFQMGYIYGWNNNTMVPNSTYIVWVATNTSQALNRIRFQSASGNYTGGTYRLYGVK